MPALPADPKAREFFYERMLSDTGFFARHVLGMDTDRDENGNATSEIGKGGVRDWGPHQELVSFLDDDSNSHSVIMAPRYSYKSSILLAFVVRKILAHPNIAILLYMHEQSMAIERCRGIRDILTENEIIKELYGDLRGPSWRADSFVTSLRTNGTLQTPTLRVGSPQKIPTGGRPNLIIFDDIVSDQNYRTELGLKKGLDCVQRSLSLAARGTRFVDVGTPYHPGDAHHWCVDSGWKRLTHLDAGVEVVTKEDRTVDVTGTARWPNLPTEHLRKYLQDGKMPYELFMSQFMLQVVSGLTQAFDRKHFHPETWNDQTHSDLTGYLLCDTAPSGSDKGDLNVLMYIGIDERHRVHILDIDIGYMRMYEFCERYLNMIARWNGKVTHRLEVWEKGHNYHSYLQHIHAQAKNRGIRIAIHGEQRNSQTVGKQDRIAHTQVRFQAGEVFVMNTVPRTWSAGTEVRSLWDPEGSHDIKTDEWLPSGDLVEQFIRFPHSTKRDIPDCFSLVDAMDKATQSRVCYWVRPSRLRQTEEVQRRRVIDSSNLRGRGSGQRFYDRYSRF